MPPLLSVGCCGDLRAGESWESFVYRCAGPESKESFHLETINGREPRSSSDSLLARIFRPFYTGKHNPPRIDASDSPSLWRSLWLHLSWFWLVFCILFFSFPFSFFFFFYFHWPPLLFHIFNTPRLYLFSRLRSCGFNDFWFRQQQQQRRRRPTWHYYRSRPVAQLSIRPPP